MPIGPAGTEVHQTGQAARETIQTFLTKLLAVADALAIWHTERGLHGGLTPDLISFTPNGAARLSAANVSAPTLYKLAYASPEQAGRLPNIDQRGDLYALGVLAYQWLLGRLPFSSDDPLTLAHSHLAVSPRAPDEVDASVPAQVSALVMRLLAK
jgi:serine/threonine protein kinase